MMSDAPDIAGELEIPWDLDHHDGLEDIVLDASLDDEWEDVDENPHADYRLFDDNGDILYGGWQISTMRAEIIRVLTDLDPDMDVHMGKSGRVSYYVSGRVIGTRQPRVKLSEEHAIEVLRAMRDVSSLPESYRPGPVAETNSAITSDKTSAVNRDILGYDSAITELLLPMGRIPGDKGMFLDEPLRNDRDYVPVGFLAIQESDRIAPDPIKLGFNLTKPINRMGSLRFFLKCSAAGLVRWIPPYNVAMLRVRKILNGSEFDPGPEKLFRAIGSMDAPSFQDFSWKLEAWNCLPPSEYFLAGQYLLYKAGCLVDEPDGEGLLRWPFPTPKFFEV